MRANEWLLQTCYHAVLVCLHEDWLEELEARIARFGRNVRGPKEERPLFMKGIMAIFAHDKPVKLATGKMAKPLTDEKDRQRMAKSMWFGFRHYVEPRELIAFNRVCTLHRNVKNLSDDGIDQRYHEQIIQRRAEMEISSTYLEDFRGGYSKEIDLRVKEIGDSRWKSSRSRIPVDDPNF
jgi:hypothetical protein